MAGNTANQTLRRLDGPSVQYIDLPHKAREIIRSWLDTKTQDVLSTTCWVEDPISMALPLDLCTKRQGR